MFHSNLFFPHKEPVCQVWEEGPVIRGVLPLLGGPSVILAVWKVGIAMVFWHVKGLLV